MTTFDLQDFNNNLRTEFSFMCPKHDDDYMNLSLTKNILENGILCYVYNMSFLYS